ncbi:hypothetical protein [Clostridium sp.]
MGEERVEERLNQHDREITEIKIDVKDIKTNIVKIEKTDVRIEINMQSILDTYKVIRNTTVGFVVLNILTMLWTISKML